MNGHKLGTQPYVYTSFALDLTPELTYTGRNVLAVRVDNSAQPNSRWYSGSGIYRHVRVVVTNPAHVAHWGVFVTTPEVSNTAVKAKVRVKVANDAAADDGVTVKTTLMDRTGQSVGSAQASIQFTAGSEKETSQDIDVANPSLWSPDSPVLYRAFTQLMKDDHVVDEVLRPSASDHSRGRQTRGWSSMVSSSTHRRQRLSRQRAAWGRGVRSRGRAQSRITQSRWP